MIEVISQAGRGFKINVATVARAKQLATILEAKGFRVIASTGGQYRKPFVRFAGEDGTQLSVDDGRRLASELHIEFAALLA